MTAKKQSSIDKKSEKLIAKKKPMAKKAKSRLKVQAKTQKKPKTKVESSITSSQSHKKIKSNKMNHFQQCLVLAALINQKRLSDLQFRIYPLYELHSEVFAPLRDFIGQYDFTREDIMQAATDLIQANVFKNLFPNTAFSERIFILTDTEPKLLVNILLELAGSEARRIIYIRGSHPHDIQKTTLEKYAIHTGQVDHRPDHFELSKWQAEHPVQQKNFPQDHFRSHFNKFESSRMMSHSNKNRGRG